MAGLKDIGDIETKLSDVAEKGGQWYLTEIKVGGDDIDRLFGQVNERAVEYARARAAELVTGIDETTRKELASLIGQGLEDNKGLSAIIDLIGDAYSFSDDRADLIARTEVSMANQAGALEGMKSAQDIGIKIRKVWLPDAEACDYCQDNGDAGPIELDDTFPTGDDAPPAHPNCRCDMASEIDESDEEPAAEEDVPNDE